MKTLSIMALVLFGMTSVAFAADPIVKQVNYNKTQNSLAVQLDNGETKNFSAKECVIKLDSSFKDASLVKGQHLSYIVFPTVDVLKDILH